MVVFVYSFTELNLSTQTSTHEIDISNDKDRCPDDNVILIYDETTMNSNSSKFLSILCDQVDGDSLPIITSKTNTMIIQYTGISYYPNLFQTFIGQIVFTYGKYF